eukprot:PLAT14617.1.p1 GENE.PLAT14617.1~~PLAT14617.1.p1  ORF type:complete len:505 (+),score=208.74 PLAT14617.1:74-1588(+)
MAQYGIKSCLEVYFVTIAAILGTGILGLPVEMDCGFWPFVVIFLLSLIMQLLVSAFMVELLQTAALTKQRRASRVERATELLAVSLEAEGEGGGGDKAGGDGDSAAAGGEEAERGLVDDGTVSSAAAPPAVTSAVSDSPSLHLLGKLFLHRRWRWLFYVAVCLHFLSVMISYALAAAQATAQLLGMSARYSLLILPLGLVFTAIITCGASRVRHIVSLLTGVKCVLLVVMVAIGGVLANAVGVQPSTHWQLIGSPFLIGTVALGGVVNAMPVTFDGTPLTRQAVWRYRTATAAGITTCWLLNVVWVLAVLHIVPQSAPGDGISLARAKQLGQISTVPVVAIVGQQMPNLGWIATLVSSFVALSVSLSYLTIGAGFKHMMDGMMLAFQALPGRFIRLRRCLIPRPNAKTMQWGMYAIGFGLILLIAQLNPRGFLVSLEVYTSLALNLESGLFVSFMYRAAVLRPAAELRSLPLQFRTLPQATSIAVALFFGGAVVFDIVRSLAAL